LDRASCSASVIGHIESCPVPGGSEDYKLLFTELKRGRLII
jgi:hypothetical protein